MVAEERNRGAGGILKVVHEESTPARVVAGGIDRSTLTFPALLKLVVLVQPPVKSGLTGGGVSDPIVHE